MTLAAKRVLIYDKTRPNKKPIETSIEGFNLLKKTRDGNRWEIYQGFIPEGPTVIEVQKSAAAIENEGKVIVPPVVSKIEKIERKVTTTKTSTKAKTTKKGTKRSQSK